MSQNSTQTSSLIERVARGVALAAKPRALLGVVGKHRSYREHFDDLDRQPDLVAVKELLYDRGIQAAVDRGIWKEVRGTADFVAFGHTLVGRRGSAGDWILARIIESPDAVGRDDYPLVIFALIRLPAFIAPEVGLADVLLRLRALESSIGKAESLAEVKSLIAESRATLAELATRKADGSTPDANGESATPPLSVVAAIVQLADDPVFAGERRRGLLSALYQIHKRIGLRGYTGESPAGRKLVDRAIHVRVPISLRERPLEAALYWNGLVAQDAMPATDSLVFICDATSAGDAPYIDVVIGPITADDFHFLHASSAKAPVIDQIPYQIDDGFVIRMDERITAARAMGVPPDGVFGDGARISLEKVEPKHWVMIAIVVGIVAVILAGAAWWMLTRQ